MHTGMGILRGLAQDTNYWMMYGLGPFADALDRNDRARNAGSRLAIIEAVRNGTTTFGDFGNGMDAVCLFMEKAGVLGRVAVMVREAVRRV